ncbi:glycosyltransferase [Candidatus Woesebacteria bacterium]|nr:glycosyltransferase [Candidatus Woesebacteria bacterium]
MSNLNIKLLSVVVPAYRQEKTIQTNLERIQNVLEPTNYNYEIICVVDGLVDNTYENAKKINSRNIKVLGYKENQGKGHAVKLGMSKARGDVIAFIDAGLELDPETLLMGLEHYKWYKADIIVGSKRHPASKVDYPWQRRIFSIGYQMMVRMLFGLKIRDTQLGMKLFKREVLVNILPKLVVKRYAFDIEMLAVAYYFGFKRIYESPVEIHYDFKDLTHSSTLKSIIRMFWDTLAVFYRLKILRYYV